MSNIAISVENISKRYLIGDTSTGSLRETLSGFFSNRGLSKTEEFWALQDISFEVKQGEATGIIGKNGAGKSTLLKILSRITEPTTGRIEIEGRVSSLLEVGTGFHPELTGRENVFLNGTILGMSRDEIKSKFDEIVEFSGVEKFLDTPVKRYSSGMKVRLAFAVAAHLEPEILIIDEVLAVGDAEFQRKCLGKMEDVAGQGRTVLFVSHSMGAIQKLCSEALLLEAGKIVLYSETEKVIDKYLSMGINYDSSDLTKMIRESDEFGKKLIITACSLLNSNEENVKELKYGEGFTIEISALAKEQLANVSFVVAIETYLGTIVTVTASEELGIFYELEKDEPITLKIGFENLFLNTGNYIVRVSARTNQKQNLDLIRTALQFEVLSVKQEEAMNYTGLWGIIKSKTTFNRVQYDYEDI
ncbi:MAG: ABC transporter ATP-binding protein [Bacteroidota bacterium]